MLKDKVVDLIEELKDQKKYAKYLRLANDGENIALEKACKQRRLGIKFEYSGQGMSHRNEMMEQSSRSCIYEFVLCLTIRELRKKFEIDSRRECASTARFYANILLNKVKRKLPLIDA